VWWWVVGVWVGVWCCVGWVVVCVWWVWSAGWVLECVLECRTVRLVAANCWEAANFWAVMCLNAGQCGWLHTAG
jgi:hypothetical protein